MSRLLLGNRLDLHLTVSAHLSAATGPLPYAAPATWPLFLAMGLLVGAVALLYNKLIIGALSLSDRLSTWPAEAKAAVIGMAAFFTGVVRAPVTGIVLAIEMTAAFSTLLPMLVACFAAMLAATALRSSPINESPGTRLAAQLEAG